MQYLQAIWSKNSRSECKISKIFKKSKKNIIQAIGKVLQVLYDIFGYKKYVFSSYLKSSKNGRIGCLFAQTCKIFKNQNMRVLQRIWTFRFFHHFFCYRVKNNCSNCKKTHFQIKNTIKNNFLQFYVKRHILKPVFKKIVIFAANQEKQ